LAKQALSQYGVNLSLLAEATEPTGRAFIQVDAKGENSIVLFKGANFAKKSPLPNHLEGYNALVLQNEIPLEHTINGLKRAKADGITTFFNPSPMPNKEDLARFPFDLVDWLILNEDETVALHAGLIGQTQPELSEGNRPVGMTGLHEILANCNIVVTRGSKGCTAIFTGRPGNDLIHSPAGTVQQPITDTTGAGDCFLGYLVSMIVHFKDRAMDFQSCLNIANQAAAISVERRGTMDSMPLLDEVKSRMEGLSDFTWPQ